MNGDSLNGHCVVVEASYAGEPQTTYIEKEVKLWRLILDPAAEPGEVRNGAAALIASLRRRRVKPETILGDEHAMARSNHAAAVQRAKTRVMPFGSNKGRQLGALPTSYLRWVLEESDYASFELKQQIRIILEAAKQQV
jgi:uncharacterized protein (DUF3820 family)